MFQHIKVASLAVAMLAVLSTLSCVSTASASVDEDRRTKLIANSAEQVSAQSAQVKLTTAAAFHSIGIGY